MTRRDRRKVRSAHRLAPVVGAIGVGAAVVALASPSGAAVASVAGGAFGEQVSITVVGVGTANSGPVPTVSLPASGGSAMQSGAATNFGPGGLFLTTGALTATTTGTTGSAGSVASGASVTDPNILQTLTATQVSSSCTSREGSAAGATAITNGSLIQNASSTVALPANPSPGLTYQGTNADTGDTFTVILNEQSTSGGVLTVNAVRFILNGPSATGFVILGQVRCGVSAAAATTTTTTRASTGTTARPATTTGGTTRVAGTDTSLARTGRTAPLAPTLALVIGAVGASFWARRRLEATEPGA